MPEPVGLGDVPHPNSTSRIRVAFGPVMSQFGSWEWIGAEMARVLRDRFDTTTFRDEIPEADVVVFIKFRPDPETVHRLTRRAAVLYCPVDVYGSSGEIDGDEPFLSQVDQIVVHCHRLEKYIRSYAPTAYIDHHLRFVSALRDHPRTRGPFLWVGAHSNLPPLLSWTRQCRLPDELWILTNVPADTSVDEIRDEFEARSRVRVERWSPERQVEWTILCRAALDIKGTDFRARHKPPVKAFDFIASGVPFATNPDSSPAAHLAAEGFRVADPRDLDWWLSLEYFAETRRCARGLRERVNRDRVADSWAGLLHDAVERRRHSSRGRSTSSSAPAAGFQKTSVVSPSRECPQADPAIRPTRRTKVAFLSLLFNWPSTGGGTIHTYEAAKFLQRAGYDVRHIYARHGSWRVGQVPEPLETPSRVLEFDEDWNDEAIRRRFRDAVDEFAPDAVLLTDSWNTKPILAEAVAGYRSFIRLAALECLCPLNNVRLLIDPDGMGHACPRNQLADPSGCRRCVEAHPHLSGGLHHAERELAGFERPSYARRLLDAFAQAEGVLVVNPAVAELVRPHARAVHVVPSGFDPGRFDLDRLDGQLPPKPVGKVSLFFAGLTREFMKGFHILEAACERLWQSRRDFELVATAETPAEPAPFIRYVGWLSQEELPRHLRAADMLVFPTLAEEALGRSAVEAMACARPVVASRIGGLAFTVRDEETGLLVEPGDVADLAAKIERLMDDAALRRRLGEAGRRRFEAEYTWDVILDEHYRHILGPPVRVDMTSTTCSSSSLPASETGSVRIGCVLAVQDRPADVLERTLQTYAFQVPAAAHKILVDFGSQPERTSEYRFLAERYGWIFVEMGPVGRPWSLSAAYNSAVAHLPDDIDVVFKGDVDVLLGPGVLAAAAAKGRDRLCLFSCRTTQERTSMLSDYRSPEGVLALLRSTPPLVSMDGEGVHAYPRRWFQGIGGFDLAFKGWGYEDSDLRLRATQSIGIVRDDETVLIHQWHPRNPDREQARRNRDYYESTKGERQVVRNGGRLIPDDRTAEVGALDAGDSSRRPPETERVVIATRSMDDSLYTLSQEFLDFGRAEPTSLRPHARHRLMGTDACGYLRELLAIEARWVINLDEDAFVLDPQGLLEMIAQMQREGYAACGMPDGGVVPVRRHHPLACNTFFNVFDLGRVRPVWQHWEKMLAAESPQDADSRVAPFARRTPREFDRFEPYYPAFFSLLNAGERILYLDAETWDDGISTLLKAPDGNPLLLHCWYARLWRHDPATRDRYARALTFARTRSRSAQGRPPRP